LKEGWAPAQETWATLLCWVLVHDLGKISSPTDYDKEAAKWLDDWQIGRLTQGVFCEIGLGSEASPRAVDWIKLLTRHQRWNETLASQGRLPFLESLMEDDVAKKLIGINQHQGIWWYNKEAFEKLLWWLFTTECVLRLSTRGPAKTAIAEAYATITELKRTSDAAGYQVHKLLGIVAAVGG
jgi:hypothetical protein